MPVAEHRGRCLCSAISFVTQGELRAVVDCHCHRCRRFTGHHLAATSAARDRVSVTDDGAQLRWYAVPGAEYGFCARCGSSLFWRSDDDPAHISICAGTLDPPTGLTTGLAWWVSEASDYFERPDVPELETE